MASFRHLRTTIALLLNQTPSGKQRYPGNATRTLAQSRRRVLNESVKDNWFEQAKLMPKFCFREAKKMLKKLGFEKGDTYFLTQMLKASVICWSVAGLVWWYNETSPLGWFEFKYRPKEERDMALLYERRKFPYPGDVEAMESFIKQGGLIGTKVGPKGFLDSDFDADKFREHLRSQRFKEESDKLWFRMRNEVVLELEEQGFFEE